MSQGINSEVTVIFLLICLDNFFNSSFSNLYTQFCEFSGNFGVLEFHYCKVNGNRSEIRRRNQQCVLWNGLELPDGLPQLAVWMLDP